ncbi:MAG: hypothetical protein J7J52_04835 [Deltaproteobacteria bacterium]|nr:hypothetical protein [Deltaproteobacteria bacterium]
MKDLSKMSEKELLNWLKELRQHRKYTPQKKRGSRIPSIFKEMSDELAVKILKELNLDKEGVS